MLAQPPRQLLLLSDLAYAVITAAQQPGVYLSSHVYRPTDFSLSSARGCSSTLGINGRGRPQRLVRNSFDHLGGGDE
jgi:hypothetical protein